MDWLSPLWVPSAGSEYAEEDACAGAQCGDDAPRAGRSPRVGANRTHTVNNGAREGKRRAARPVTSSAR
jgi:hypothetical protein